MKLRFILILLAAIACQRDIPNTTEIRDQLFEKLATAPQVTSFVTAHPTNCILKVEYCATNDCDKLLQETGLQVPVYSREHAFMRNINNFLVILEVNLSTARPYLIYQLRSGKTVGDLQRLEL